MRKSNTISKIAFSAVIVILICLLQWSALNNMINVMGDSLHSHISQVEDRSLYHPYGRPAREPLGWEADPKLRQLRGTYGAVLLMAAFRTTLPDPLPGEKLNVDLAAQLLAGTVVGAGDVFSMNKTIGPYSRERGFREGPAYSGNNIVASTGGGVCKISTTLYNTAVLANMEILQRRAHGMLVPYVPPGQDATVSSGVQDFSFRNNAGHPIVIWSATEGDTLTIAFYGSTLPPRVTWHHELLSWQKRHTIYRSTNDLEPGRERLVSPGADGMALRSWVTIEYADGSLAIRELGVDYYRPMPRVVEKRLMQ